MPRPVSVPQLRLLFAALATEKGVTHIWRVDTNAHDTGAMSSNFY